jgi:hypothetical protein
MAALVFSCFGAVEAQQKKTPPKKSSSTSKSKRKTPRRPTVT